nr:response regulator transcription factor [Verticiella sp. GG226]
MRRAYPGADATEDHFGAYRFALHQREVFLNGERIALKPKEYDLALYLFRNAGRLLSHDHLLAELWGVSEIDTRTLTTHVSQLRRKLDLRPHHGYRLAPVYGIGYRFERVSTEPTCA